VDSVNLRKILPILVVVAVVAAAGAWYWTNHRGSGAGISDSDAAEPAAASPQGLLTVKPDDMTMGDPKAPVTMIEYASLTCPHCAHFEIETFPELQKQYIDTGKVLFVYRDFPLDALALKASILARCAGKERFFNFLQTLFQNQQSWEQQDPDKAQEALASIAKLGGIGKEQFDACMNDETLKDKVVNSRHDAEQQLDIESTPTFFINGNKVSGAKPLDVYAAVINQYLPKSDGAGH
jgi:protein-disulfide isomerase